MYYVCSLVLLCRGEREPAGAQEQPEAPGDVFRFVFPSGLKEMALVEMNVLAANAANFAGLIPVSSITVAMSLNGCDAARSVRTVDL